MALAILEMFVHFQFLNLVLRFSRVRGWILKHEVLAHMLTHSQGLLWALDSDLWFTPESFFWRERFLLLYTMPLTLT